MNGRAWTDPEIAVLRRRYANSPTAVLAAAFGRSLSTTYQKAKTLGLAKSKEYLASEYACRLRRGDEIGKDFRFKKGLVPWNKGTHFAAGGRSVETRFKKGNMSGAAQHNYVPIGTTRLSKDGYLERKTNDDHPVPARRWVGVHRLVWVAANGPIPKGHIVAFKAGMRTNVEGEITIDRIECITLRDNMLRNTLHRYPKEIAHAIQVRAALNRRINREQQKHK